MTRSPKAARPPWPPARLAVLSVVAGAIALGGCTGGGSELTVQGAVEAQDGGSSTGFVFDVPTRLADDRVPPSEGDFVGHCVFAEASAQVVSLSVARVDVSPGDLGLRSFQVLLSVGPASTSASVQADVGGVVLTGSGAPGDAACDVSPAGLSAHDGVASIDVQCTLRGAGSKSADVTASLDFTGCE